MKNKSHRKGSNVNSVVKTVGSGSQAAYDDSATDYVTLASSLISLSDHKALLFSAFILYLIFHEFSEAVFGNSVKLVRNLRSTNLTMIYLSKWVYFQPVPGIIRIKYLLLSISLGLTQL